jgi:very-short-patch-repair endonuclease
MADKKELVLQAIRIYNMTKEDEVPMPGEKGEHRFHPVRRWRFDYAYPFHKIAIEVHGGIWTQGGHTRGSGFMEDRDKMNEAQILGWIVLEFPVTALENDPFKCVDQIKRALALRDNLHQ